jgi:hypothetical protein
MMDYLGLIKSSRDFQTSYVIIFLLVSKNPFRHRMEYPMWYFHQKIFASKRGPRLVENCRVPDAVTKLPGSVDPDAIT